MIGAVSQKPRQAVVEILDFMRKNRLALDDLIQVGGEDFGSASPKRIEKARGVEKCWSLMTRLSVPFADLEQAPGNLPTRPSRRRRGEGHFSQVIEKAGVSGTFAHQVKSNEINDLSDSVPVGELEANPEPSQ